MNQLNKPPLGGRGQRIHSLDLARGFTVLLMPSIHVVMLYSTESVQHSALGILLSFIAEGPGAQLFMMIMGISLVFSSRINAKYVFKRALILLVAAYLLNFLKFIVPLLFGLMPQNLLSELHLSDKTSTLTFFFFLGDILHFAAIAYIIIYAVSRLKYFHLLSSALAILIIFISPLLWDIRTGNTFIDYLLQLSGGHPPNVFFPLFPGSSIL